MKRIFTYVWSGALFFALAAGVGCVKQDLDNRKNEGSVEITLNWEEGKTPAGYRIHFYPVVEDGAEPVESGEGVTESVPVYRAVEGSRPVWTGKLPVGTYKVIVYNNDDKIGLRNEEDYDRAELFLALDEGSDANAGLPASRVNECICQPDNVMLATQLDKPEDFDGAEYLLEVPFNDVVKVSASPKSILKYVDIDFKIEGDVSLENGRLTGISQAVCCRSLVCNNDCYSVQYTPEPCSGEGDFDYETRISVLDVVSPNAGATHMLHLNLLLNGTSSSYPIAVNVTDQVRSYLAAHGGKISVGEALPIVIRLEMIGNVPSVSVDPWDNTGFGSGTIGNTSGSGSAGVQ